MSPSTKKWDKSHFPVDQIKIASENDYLYDRFSIANHDDQALYKSIKEVGIQEPLVITLDNYLLSGHRRISCAKRLGHETVPVRIIDKTFEALNKSDRLALLRLFNQQRDKSTGEKIREKLLEVDKSEAH
jgi:ABC-type transport system involved in cytochrome c biogenesis ATPase subunit